MQIVACLACFRELQLQAINSFGKSLQYGCNYIYQSISRLLTMWLDYGKRFYELQGELTQRSKNELTPAVKKEYRERKKALEDINSLISKFARLRLYLYYREKKKVTHSFFAASQKNSDQSSPRTCS